MIRCVSILSTWNAAIFHRYRFICNFKISHLDTKSDTTFGMDKKLLRPFSLIEVARIKWNHLEYFDEQFESVFFDSRIISFLTFFTNYKNKITSFQYSNYGNMKSASQNWMKLCRRQCVFSFFFIKFWNFLNKSIDKRIPSSGISELCSVSQKCCVKLWAACPIC